MRIILGLLAGGTMSLAYTMGARLAPASRSGLTLSMLSSGGQLGGALSPMMVGVIGQISLSYALLANAGAYLVAFALAALPSRKRDRLRRPNVSSPVAGRLAFPHDRIAQHTDARNVHLDQVAVLHVLRRTIGAHPDHVARIERHVCAHAADEGLDAEDRIGNTIERHLPPVQSDGTSSAAGSRSVTIHGPIGLNVSVFLPRHNVRSPCCHVRSLTSLPIV